LWYVAVSAGSLAILLPLAWGIASSLRPLDEIFKYTMPFSWHALIPERLTVAAYVSIFHKGFGRALMNTLLVCAATILLGLLVNSMAGFVFAKLEFRGKKLLFAIILLTFMVPFEAIAIPLYSVAKEFGLLNSYQGLILPGVAQGLAIFLFKQLFEEIPTELLESGVVDGAGWFRVYYQVFLPLAKPALISAGLILFLFQWNAFIWPLVATTSVSLRQVQVAIAHFQVEFQTFWNELFAGSMLSAFIPAAILIPFQKYYISGIASTGLHG